MDRENKAVKICNGSPQKTQKNLILSFLAPPYRLAWPRSCWINYPGRALQCRLSCSLPPLQCDDLAVWTSAEKDERND